MGKLTVDEIQGRIAGIVDQDEQTSNISTNDYSLRLKYMNMAQSEWAELYDWQALYKEYHLQIPSATGNASIVLPGDFRKLASYPVIVADGQAVEFPEVRPQEDGRYLDTDKRVLVLGNPYDGYTLRVKGTELASGASVKVPYYASAGSLVSPLDSSMIPNADYLVARTVAYLWEAREDPRFPQMKAEAERILANLLERENVPSEAADGRVKTIDEARYGFRMGRD